MSFVFGGKRLGLPRRKKAEYLTPFPNNFLVENVSFTDRFFFLVPYSIFHADYENSLELLFFLFFVVNFCLKIPL